MKLLTFFLLCFTSRVLCGDDYPYPEVIKYGSSDEHGIKDSSPRIIIIGSGPAGIAAASKLVQNGFTNVTILEAENRIGGRVYSVQFGEYAIDLGGQWVHGEKGSSSFQLAWPLGLLERFSDAFNFTSKLFISSGSSLPSDVSLALMNFLKNEIEDAPDNTGSLQTLGEYAEMKCKEYFRDHPEISSNLHRPIMDYLSLLEMGLEAADNWHESPLKTNVPWTEAEGDQAINWKERTYGTILDILIKKYPDPKEELPVLSNTFLNNKVTKINYNEPDGSVKLLNSDGREYVADHVIFTPSLGVLKANYERIFDPPLPPKKINSIKNLGFGHVGKIFLYYENPWWPIDNDIYMKGIVWTEDDKKELLNDPNRKWMLGVTYFARVEHKPKLLLVWMSSHRSIDVEFVPEELFRYQIVELINRFFGNSYNLTQPTEIIRSMWNTNENFRGTYSYRSLESDPARASYKHLAQPVMHNGKPILQFAGEATDKHWGTIHGAISSGWREADRLIKIYPS